MFVLIGYIIVAGSVLGGFIFAGGHLVVLWQPAEVIIIAGAALGAFVVSNQPTVLKAVGKGLVLCLKGSKYNKALYMETLTLLYKIFNKIRQSGMLSVEADIESPNESELFKSAPAVMADHHALTFICDYLRMMTLGNLEPYQVESLMEQEIETHHKEGLQPADGLQRLADGLPAFGIVAAVMGVVHTMESVGIPPAELGKLIAAALVGTFLGILLSYGFVGPLSGLLTQKVDESTKYFECIKSGIIATMNGYPPQTAVEFARKSIFETARPGFLELEEHIKSNK
jgi:chemotaxis protein MotA